MRWASTIMSSIPVDLYPVCLTDLLRLVCELIYSCNWHTNCMPISNSTPSSYYKSTNSCRTNRYHLQCHNNQQSPPILLSSKYISFNLYITTAYYYPYVRFLMERIKGIYWTRYAATVVIAHWTWNPEIAGSIQSPGTTVETMQVSSIPPPTTMPLGTAQSIVRSYVVA